MRIMSCFRPGSRRGFYRQEKLADTKLLRKPSNYRQQVYYGYIPEQNSQHLRVHFTRQVLTFGQPNWDHTDWFTVPWGSLVRMRRIKSKDRVEFEFHHTVQVPKKFTNYMSPSTAHHTLVLCLPTKTSKEMLDHMSELGCITKVRYGFMKMKAFYVPIVCSQF